MKRLWLGVICNYIYSINEEENGVIHNVEGARVLYSLLTYICLPSHKEMFLRFY